MSIFRRRLMMPQAEFVPPYDAEIEYLETQGNCNIPTTCVPSGNHIKIMAKYLINGYTTRSDYVSWYIAYTDEQTQCFRGMKFRSDNSLVITNGATSLGSGSDARYTDIVFGQTYEIETGGSTVKVNGVQKTTRGASSTINTGIMRVMLQQFKGRLYYFKISDNGVRILDCIPVRVGNVGYMYDKVSRHLFGNDGTGELILGNDVI